jgi:hypothetical protein
VKRSPALERFVSTPPSSLTCNLVPAGATNRDVSARLRSTTGTSAADIAPGLPPSASFTAGITVIGAGLVLADVEVQLEPATIAAPRNPVKTSVLVRVID